MRRLFLGKHEQFPPAFDFSRVEHRLTVVVIGYICNRNLYPRIVTFTLELYR
jgi:hypothetical protein